MRSMPIAYLFSNSGGLAAGIEKIFGSLFKLIHVRKRTPGVGCVCECPFFSSGWPHGYLLFSCGKWMVFTGSGALEQLLGNIGRINRMFRVLHNLENCFL
jgi:hypothetical protein